MTLKNLSEVKNKKNKIEKLMLLVILFVSGVLVFNIILSSFVSAHENFNETKMLIDSNISCDKLDDEQLNEIGDYYMEQMHPGESHELMHQMMGGEDSEFVKEMHINMAKNIYCKENTGMMGSGCGMMGSGMMKGNMMYGNMMQGNYYNWNIYSVLYLILILGLIVIVVLIIIKLTKGLTGKR